jgi:hypothetical protein
MWHNDLRMLASIDSASRGSASPYALPASGVYQHPALGQVLYNVAEVSDDPDTQVAQVIGMMRGYANDDASSPLFHQDLMQCARTDDPVSDVWNYLNRFSGSRGMQFVSDENTGADWDESYRWRPLVEVLIRPVDQAWLDNPQGDCDDFSMYGAAHLISRGIPCSFATVAADSQDPSIYSHVYLVAYPNGQRIPMDLSHGPYLGWEVASQYGKFREWPLGGDLGLLGWGLLLAGSYLLYKAVN